MGAVIGSIFVPRISCDHVKLAGKGWLVCPCGARCKRDETGSIVEYSLDTPEPVPMFRLKELRGVKRP